MHFPFPFCSARSRAPHFRQAPHSHTTSIRLAATPFWALVEPAPPMDRLKSTNPPLSSTETSALGLTPIGRTEWMRQSMAALTTISPISLPPSPAPSAVVCTRLTCLVPWRTPAALPLSTPPLAPPLPQTYWRTTLLLSAMVGSMSYGSPLRKPSRPPSPSREPLPIVSSFSLLPPTLPAPRPLPS